MGMQAGAIGSPGLRALQSLQRADSGLIRLDDAGGSFGDTLERALGEVTSAQTRSTNAIDAFVRGEAVEIHDVMAAAEEAGIALDMLVEIRNKLIDAYRAVINMQG